MPEESDARGLVLGHEGEEGLLLLARDAPFELKPPRLYGGAAEAELRERDTQLRHPARVRHGRRRLPDRVPALVCLPPAFDDRSAGGDGPAAAPAAGERLVATHAGGVHAEAVRREVVVVAVQRHDEPVGVVHQGVAAHEAPRNSAAVVEPRADVERLGIVDDVHLGALACRLSLVRVELREGGDRRRSRPRRLVETAVDGDAPARGHRMRYRPIGVRSGSLLCGARPCGEGIENDSEGHRCDAPSPNRVPRRAG